MNQSTTNQRSTRTDLLEAARHVFARNGFDGASVRAITAEAGANLGAVTYHFGSKRALYDAMLEEGFRPLVQRVRRAVDGEGSALDRMVAVAEAYFEHLADHGDLPHLLLQEVAAGREPPDPAKRVILEVRRLLVKLHEEGQIDGSIRSGDPTFTALSVISQPTYLTLIAPALRALTRVDLDDHTTRDEVTRHVAGFVRRGLAPDTEAHR